MKKGFTLSEVLVTLTVIGIVSALTIPVLNKANPDKDKITYQKAIYTLERAMDSTINDPKLKLTNKYWADENLSETAFCDAISGALNTAGRVSCNETSSYENPNFITTDGIRFWGFEGKIYSLSAGNNVRSRTIFVERRLTDKEKNILLRNRDSFHSEPGLKIQILYNGKIQIPETQDWDYETSLAEKF